MKSNKLIIILAFLVSTSCSVNNAHAKLVTSVASGDWSAAGTWDNGVPVDGDDVLIKHAVTIEDESISPGNLYIVLRDVGALNFTGTWGFLVLGSGSQIILESGSAINGNGFLEAINIGGTWAYSGFSNGTLGGPNTLDETTPIGGDPGDVPPVYDPLPVELLFFNARSDQDQVILNWSTATELNNYFFTLEKSNNGKDFENLDELAGSGTTKIQADYSFTDPSPYLGMSYYRLSQTDYDGTTEVFPVISVFFDGTMSFRIGPNPVIDSWVNLRTSGKADNELLQLNIIDSQGRLVENQQLKANYFGNVDYEIQLKNPLKQGIYIFELVSERRKEYIKVAAN